MIGYDCIAQFDHRTTRLLECLKCKLEMRLRLHRTADAGQLPNFFKVLTMTATTLPTTRYNPIRTTATTYIDHYTMLHHIQSIISYNSSYQTRYIIQDSNMLHVCYNTLPYRIVLWFITPYLMLNISYYTHNTTFYELYFAPLPSYSKNVPVSAILVLKLGPVPRQHFPTNMAFQTSQHFQDFVRNPCRSV